jgi:hypothetical protein
LYDSEEEMAVDMDNFAAELDHLLSSTLEEVGDPFNFRTVRPQRG